MENEAWRQSALAAIRYFDVIDFAPSLLELQAAADCAATLSDFASAMEPLLSAGKIGFSQGLYFLPGRLALVESRRRRYRDDAANLRVALRAGRLLARLPFIRGIALYSSLSLMNSSPSSDADLFFTVASGRLWTARFFINSLLKFLRLRPAGNNGHGKICASYYADEAAADLQAINRPTDYLGGYYGQASYLFIFGDGNDFFRQNDWIKSRLPNWLPPEFSKPIKLGRISRLAKRAAEHLAGIIPETCFKNIQLRWLPARYHQAADGKRVILSERLIKLHLQDKNTLYNELFAAKNSDLDR